MEVESALLAAVQYLLDEGSATDCHQAHGHSCASVEDWPVSAQLQLLRQLLCERAPEPELPSAISDDVQTIYQFLHAHRFLTPIDALRANRTITTRNQKQHNLFCWRGDITTLSGVTAITNAANSQMLGCFQPSHRCLDNVIHSWAGPGLRKECFDLMSQGAIELPVGRAITTSGHYLPAPYIVHTVGPQLRRGAKPTAEQRQQLEDCYASILQEVEKLPTTGSRKSVAICCVSTGLFAFPPVEAASIAVQATVRWLEEHDTTITDIVFNTFTEADTVIYQQLLGKAQSEPRLTTAPSGQCTSLGRARDWLLSADAILVSAGAGLSAADGLDYTSPELFTKHFPAFKQYGLTTLYSVFGFSKWPSEQHRWGYYFSHLNMIKSWPRSSMYTGLISWLRNRSSSGAEVHVRTSNADGLFLANGWSEDALSTPQGSYAVLQCLANCRSDATVPTAPLLEAATPFLDPVTQTLTSPDKIPQCQYCGGKMNICVRAGHWFNERPFAPGERQWRQFQANTRRQGRKLVILELGVGQSTPGVLQWPNEDMVERDGGNTKLVRVGLGVDATVPLELEAQGLATYIDGDIKAVLSALCSEPTQ